MRTYLTPGVPHLLWAEVGGVGPEATGVDPGQLPGVVVHKLPTCRGRDAGRKWSQEVVTRFTEALALS